MSTPTIKYRAACDHCSAAKIKCTQERPQCARCRTLGRDCNYSRSLRAGKPPRSSQILNRRIATTPVLPRSTQPLNGGPMCRGFPPYGAYPATSTKAPHDPIWPANASSPYPTLPAMATYSSTDLPLFTEPYTPDQKPVGTPLDPEWFFDFNDAAIPSDSLALHLDSRESTQQLSPISDGTRSSCTSQGADFMLHEDLAHMPPSAPGTSCQGSGGDQCLRTATEALNRLHEMPYIQVDEVTKQFSIDHVLSNTAHAVQVCHELISCPCVKDFHLPVLIGIIASKILAWYQAIAYIRDPSTEIPRPDGKCLPMEIVVDGQLPLGAYKLDDEMGWVLKNHIVFAQLQSLREIIERYESQFCTVDLLEQMHEGGKVYERMSGFLKGRLQFTLQEVEARLRASGS